MYVYIVLVVVCILFTQKIKVNDVKEKNNFKVSSAEKTVLRERIEFFSGTLLRMEEMRVTALGNSSPLLFILWCFA